MTASPSASPVVLARRLAIQLLHEAQVAAPSAIHGVVTAVNGEPSRYLPAAQAAGQPLWAQVFSNPAAPAVPSALELSERMLTLMISLDTKGVLELRAWVRQDGVALERVVSISD